MRKSSYSIEAQGLAGDYLSEFDELGLVYGLLRPSITGEDDLTHLEVPILDSLEFWKTWCSEPGFLAKSVLRWNGIESLQDCDDPQRVADRERPIATKRKSGTADAKIKIYPNPASQVINFEFEQELGQVSVTLFDVHGRKFAFSEMLIYGYSVQLPVREIPTGFYIIQLHMDDQKPIHQKISILR